MNSASLQPIVSRSKADQTTEMLLTLSRKLGAGAKLPTIRELCDSLQISRPTLDAALDRLEIKGILHRKHGSGIYISSLARTTRIGTVIDPNVLGQGGEGGNFWQMLLNSLQGQCRKRESLLTNYMFDAAHDRDKFGPLPLELDLQNGRVDALITMGMAREGIDFVRALELPCVMYTDDEAYAPRVYADRDPMITDGVNALVRAGCRKIGFAYPVGDHNSPYQQCLDVFKAAIRSAGLDIDFAWLMPFRVTQPHYRSLEASREFFGMWTNATNRPDGLLSANDEYTSGVLHAMELLELRSPGDLLVASHANKGLELFGKFDVIRLEYDTEEHARLLLSAVDDLLAGRQVPAEQIATHRLVRPKNLVEQPQALEGKEA